MSEYKCSLLDYYEGRGYWCKLCDIFVKGGVLHCIECHRSHILNPKCLKVSDIKMEAILISSPSEKIGRAYNK